MRYIGINIIYYSCTNIILTRDSTVEQFCYSMLYYIILYLICYDRRIISLYTPYLVNNASIFLYRLQLRHGLELH